MSTKKRIVRARVQLLLKNPFFGYLASYLELREHKSSYPTGTDGVCLYYYPEKIEGLEDEEIEGVFAHEVMHLALGHLWRCGPRMKRLWNVAADYAVNAILKERFRLPKGILYEKDFENKSAEQIYNELLYEQELANSRDTVDDHNVWGYAQTGDEYDISQADGNSEESSDAQNESKAVNEDMELWKQRAIEAAAVAKHQGMLPLGIERIITELAYPSLNWRQILHHYVKQHSAEDYNWMRPNKRLIQYGVYYPSSRAKQLKMVVAVDTSGSVSNEQLGSFLSEVRSILQSFKFFQARLIGCDASIHTDMMATHDADFEPFRNCMAGGGGTDFRPVFSKIEDDPPEVLLYLTDGDGKYPDSSRQSFDVIWVMNSYREPPFGRVIRLQGYEQ